MFENSWERKKKVSGIGQDGGKVVLRNSHRMKTQKGSSGQEMGAKLSRKQLISTVVIPFPFYHFT